MTWERYTNARSAVVDDPVLSIHADGDGRINAVADQQWFEGTDAVAIYLDADGPRLALEPDPDDGTALSLYREDGEAGAEVNVHGSLLELGLDVEAVDLPARVPLDWDADREFAVADLAPLFDDVDQDADRADERAPDHDLPEWIVDEVREADDLGTREQLEILLDHLTADGPIERPASEIGAPIGLSGSEVAHNIRHIDDGFRVEKRDPPTDAAASLWYVERAEDVSNNGDDTEAEAAAEADGGAVAGVGADDTVQIRKAAAHCESLQDLADRFDVDVERARGLAMSAGVYADLQDQVDRPGVDRDA